MRKQLEIPKGIVKQVNEYLRSVFPEEGCGFLTGNQESVIEFHAVENELHSRFAYYMNPSEQIAIMIEAEERNLDILAIVHSHPSSPAYPSQTDLNEARWTNVCYIIVSLEDEIEPVWTGWILSSTEYEEIPLLMKKLTADW